MFSNIFLTLILDKILCIRGNTTYDGIVRNNMAVTRMKPCDYDYFKIQDYKND